MQYRAAILAAKHIMAFFASAIDTLKIVVIAIGAGLGGWGVINLLEGYGNDNPGANARDGYPASGKPVQLKGVDDDTGRP